jgi:hypothetical protein
MKNKEFDKLPAHNNPYPKSHNWDWDNMKGKLTTNEIFQESMKLSEPAYKEKGDKLKQYQEWLKKKWISIEEAEKIIKEIKDDCKEENTR